MTTIIWFDLNLCRIKNERLTGNAHCFVSFTLLFLFIKMYWTWIYHQLQTDCLCFDSSFLLNGMMIISIFIQDVTCKKIEHTFWRTLIPLILTPYIYVLTPGDLSSYSKNIRQNVWDWVYFRALKWTSRKNLRTIYVNAYAICNSSI